MTWKDEWLDNILNGHGYCSRDEKAGSQACSSPGVTESEAPSSLN